MTHPRLHQRQLLLKMRISMSWHSYAKLYRNVRILILLYSGEWWMDLNSYFASKSRVIHKEFPMLIKFGDKGTNVESIQQALKDLGYGLEVDGAFGNQT